MNLNFYYGGVFHTGFETLLLKGLKPAIAAMKKESRKRTSRHTLSNEDRDEIAIQFRVIEAIITAASRQRFMKSLKLNWAEKVFKFKLKPSGLTFCCRADGGGSYRKDNVLVEIKTARTVNNNYFTALEFDKQVYGEVCAMKASGLKYPTKCAYCVFRKPSKYIKKGQSVDGFIKEIKQDLITRPDWYFVVDAQSKKFPYILTLGRNTLRQTKEDLNSFAALLQERYDGGILDPSYWPPNTRQCLSYGVCPYLMLCRNLAKYKLYLKLYQQREIMYEEEQKELQR